MLLLKSELLQFNHMRHGRLMTSSVRKESGGNLNEFGEQPVSKMIVRDLYDSVQS